MRLAEPGDYWRKPIKEQKIVSGDAIFAQKELSEKVVEKGGEYLWKLRANQGKMYELAKEHFEKMPDQYLDRASSLEKGHGRIDERAHSDQFPTVGPNRVSVFGASL